MNFITRNTLVVACSLLILPLAACGEDDPDSDTDPYERPEGAQQLISDAQLLEFEEVGGVVHGGLEAPDLTGTYLFNDTQVEWTNSAEWPHSNVWCHDEVTYEAGDDPDTYVETIESINCDSEGVSNSNFISGTGNCFTLYRDTSYIFEGCSSESLGIFSACLDDSGDMIDPRSADVILSLEGESCDQITADGRLLAVDEMAVVTQADGRAERVDN